MLKTKIHQRDKEQTKENHEWKKKKKEEQERVIREIEKEEYDSISNFGRRNNNPK